MKDTTWYVIGAVVLVGVVVLALRGGGSGARVTASTLAVSGGGDPARTAALQSIYGSALNLFGGERRLDLSSRTAFQLRQLDNERARALADVQLQIARQQRGAQREQAIINQVGNVVSKLNPLNWF